MEFTSLFPAIIFTIVTLISVSLFFRNKKSSPKPNLPPGSRGWPLIGETYEFLSRPENFVHDRMKKYSAKIFKTKVFGEPMVVLCGTAGHKFLAANDGKCFRSWRLPSMQRLFRSSYQTDMTREEEVHLTRAPGFLRPEALIGFVEGMDYVVQNHLKTSWEGKQMVNTLEQIELVTIAASSRFFLGLKDPRRMSKLAPFLHDINPGLHSIAANFPGTIFYRAKKSANALRRELMVIIREKKAAILDGNQINDILAHLIVNKGHNGEYMSENEIAHKISGLLIGAFSSLSSSLTFTMKFIGERPDVYEKIRKEHMEISQSKTSGQMLGWQDLQKMKYTWNVCLEGMRYIPPLQGTFREATTDFTYEGYTIPKGWKIYWTVSSTNKDPELFPNPEEFVPTRFEQENFPPPYTNIPFGGGPRICPGKEYVRLVMLTFLHNMVKSYKWEVMFPDEIVIPSMIPLPSKGLPIRLTPI